jgi:hypothetical protein
LVPPFHLSAILSKLLYVHQPVYPDRSQNFRRVRVFTAVRGTQSRYTSNHMMRQHLYGSEEIVVRSDCTRPRWGDRIPHEHHSMEQRTIQMLLHRRLCCTKKADLVESAETSERGSHDDRATPIQMAPLPGRHHFVVRAVVPAVFTQLPRPGRNDARAGIACGSYHDLPMGPTVCS